MILQCLAAYDSKARAFMLPFYCTTLAVGARAFAAAANQPGHQICMHPEDFTLFHLGAFDDQTATFAPLPEHVNLGLAANYKDEKNVQSKKS